MARQRMVKPQFMESESLAMVSRDARLTFVILLMIADDEGRVKLNPKVLVSQMYPLDDSVTKDVLEGFLYELQAVGCIRFYLVENSKYLDIPNFLKYQKINRPMKSTYPAFSINKQVNEPFECNSLNRSVNESVTESVSESVSGSPRSKEARKEKYNKFSFVESEGNDEPVENSSHSPFSLTKFINDFGRSKS